MTNHQSFSPVIITITGASLASLAAYLYCKKPPQSGAQPPFQLTNQNITANFVAAIPEITPETNLELATATHFHLPCGSPVSKSSL